MVLQPWHVFICSGRVLSEAIYYPNGNKNYRDDSGNILSVQPFILLHLHAQKGKRNQLSNFKRVLPPRDVQSNWRFMFICCSSSLIFKHGPKTARVVLGRGCIYQLPLSLPAVWPQNEVMETSNCVKIIHLHTRAWGNQPTPNNVFFLMEKSWKRHRLCNAQCIFQTKCGFQCLWQELVTHETCGESESFA